VVTKFPEEGGTVTLGNARPGEGDVSKVMQWGKEDGAEGGRARGSEDHRSVLEAWETIADGLWLCWPYLTASGRSRRPRCIRFSW